MFEANGLIWTDIELFNLKKNYYQGDLNYFRFACEICFCCLLVFYFTIEFIEIVGDIKGKKNEYEKEQKKRQARENRRREMQEMRDQELDNGDLTPGGGLKTPDIAKNQGKNEPPVTFDSLDLRKG